MNQKTLNRVLYAGMLVIAFTYGMTLYWWHVERKNNDRLRAEFRSLQTTYRLSQCKTNPSMWITQPK